MPEKAFGLLAARVVISHDYVDVVLLAERDNFLRGVEVRLPGGFLHEEKSEKPGLFRGEFNPLHSAFFISGVKFFRHCHILVENLNGTVFNFRFQFVHILEQSENRAGRTSEIFSEFSRGKAFVTSFFDEIHRRGYHLISCKFRFRWHCYLCVFAILIYNI